MKALITLLSTGIGLGAVALAALVQHDPLVFGTNRDPLSALSQHAAPTPLSNASIQRTVAPARNPVIISESEWRPVRRVRQVKITPASDAPDVRVVPAPCRHGEYRKLEAKRGVWLMCPGHY